MIWDIPFKMLVNQKAWSNRQWIPDQNREVLKATAKKKTTVRVN